MSNKLKDRLMDKTAGLAESVAAAQRISIADQPPVTMPGQLGAFRLEAQKYTEQIDALTTQLAHAKQNGPVHHTSHKISLELIDESPYQPRLRYDQIDIDNLGHSLAAAGQEDPITVRQKVDGRYELISGHRRVRAARGLGWTGISANIVDRSDREAELATMLQNEARVDLSDYERGKLYQRAITGRFATKQAQVANLFGTTQGLVSRCMAMLKLPSYCIDLLEEKPSLFGVNCADSIKQLIDRYPNDTDLIQRAVMRLVDENADQKSVKPWVEQMVKQRNNIVQPKERSIVTDRAGRPMFTAKITEREITVRINAKEVDTKEMAEMLLATLRQRADKSSP